MGAFKAAKHYLKNTDLYLLFLALLCSAYGVVLVYSATRASGSSRYIMIQSLATVVGVAAFVIMSLIDLEAMSNWWKIFVVLNILLQLTLIPFGKWANGQRSWIEIANGAFSLQPAELGKLLFVFTFAAHLSEIREHVSEWRGILVLGLHTLLMMGAIVLSSKDTGMAIQYFMIALVMMFAAGLSYKWIGLGAVLGLLSVPVLWNFVFKDYQKNRILVLFDPSIDPNTAYQTTQGKIAIGSGQFWGQGLGNGAMTQMGIVPERRTDLIFSVAGEELGFVGCMAIIGLLLLLILRLMYVAFRGSTGFSSLLAVGICSMFLFQTFMNIFMVIGLLPVMGLTLPFFSYGGTSVVTMYAALGIAAGVRMREKPSWLQ
ncbi:FtsW/RodA/SpoVE family cell cycle protein [Agathobaculum sp.]|uniref:FtsW/RodA/SpoVE family cell cycle protein n=1 Tax=Agathobaculum sp. TaxID=2048138 RepID=UPI002A805DB0|nr:FtsW/RodA/SpoVE family cell cycle protein [Agathobaculum sp.]MDY3617519.1 FtsW/RodA/SpoVE family cell cycle protein [Agathobaculum sp.]